MPAPTPTRILVVDDENDIAGLIKHTLERAGDIEVEIVGSGDAALKSVFERAPDLMILDLNLPVLSGSEVCRLLRAKPATAQLPIIMLTARTGEADRVSGLDWGLTTTLLSPSVCGNSPPGFAPCCAANRAVLSHRRRCISLASCSPTSMPCWSAWRAILCG